MTYTKEKWKNRLASRSDMSGQVAHLTRSTVIGGKKVNALATLMRILKEGRIIGSTTGTGFICGSTPAVCFHDAPLYSLIQNIYVEQQYRMQDKNAPVRYEGFGVMLPKPYIYRLGGRPVLYDRTSVAKKYLPPKEWWRIVNFDLSDDTAFIDWSHEREWRVPNDVQFDLAEVSVLLPNRKTFARFIGLCRKETATDILGTIKGIVNLGDVFF